MAWMQIILGILFGWLILPNVIGKVRALGSGE